MNSENFSSENNSSNVGNAKLLLRQQDLLNQRIQFWKSVYDASIALQKILLNTDNRNVYIVPDGIRESEADRTEVHFLRSMLKDAKEFISCKINSLELKYKLFQNIADD